MGILKPIALLLFLVFSLSSNAVVEPRPTLSTPFDLSKIKVKHIERLAGKKLSLIQKIKLKLLLKAAKKIDDGPITEKQKKQADVSMVLGIISLALLPVAFTSIGIIALLSIPAALLAIILGAKSRKGNSNKKGLIGIITGAITLSVIIVYSLLVIISFSGFTFE